MVLFFNKKQHVSYKPAIRPKLIQLLFLPFLPLTRRTGFIPAVKIFYMR